MSNNQSFQANKAAFQAEFIGVKYLKGKGVTRFEFEVADVDGDECLARLGGFPKLGTSRWCAIALIDGGLK